MSYRVRINGTEVTCDTVDEVRALVAPTAGDRTIILALRVVAELPDDATDAALVPLLTRRLHERR